MKIYTQTDKKGKIIGTLDKNSRSIKKLREEGKVKMLDTNIAEDKKLYDEFQEKNKIESKKQEEIKKSAVINKANKTEETLINKVADIIYKRILESEATKNDAKFTTKLKNILFTNSNSKVE